MLLLVIIMSENRLYDNHEENLYSMILIKCSHALIKLLYLFVTSSLKYESTLFSALMLLSFALIPATINKETMNERAIHK